MSEKKKQKREDRRESAPMKVRISDDGIDAIREAADELGIKQEIAAGRFLTFCASLPQDVKWAMMSPVTPSPEKIARMILDHAAKPA